jgi:hypothetical protein
MLQFYDAFFWLHVGANMTSIEAKEDFVKGFKWVVERPAYGFEETCLDTPDLMRAVDFEHYCVDQLGVNFTPYKKMKKMTSDMDEDFEQEEIVNKKKKENSEQLQQQGEPFSFTIIKKLFGIMRT